MGLNLTDVDGKGLYECIFSAPRLQKLTWNNGPIIQKRHLLALERAIDLAKKAHRPFRELETNYECYTRRICLIAGRLKERLKKKGVEFIMDTYGY
jgi:hypothetical protein